MQALEDRPTDELLDELRQRRDEVETGDAARARRDELLAALTQRPRTEVPMETLVEASGRRRALVYMARKIAGQREEKAAR